MKKLGKFDIEKMEREFKVLENPEKILGGGFVSAYDINGGSITNWEFMGYKYAVFTDASGKCIVLDGVNVVGCSPLASGNAGGGYFWNKIYVCDDYFGFDDLMHEYGHYMQEQSMGSYSYYNTVAIPSVMSIFFKNENHMNMWTERIATFIGNMYASLYYGYPYTYP